MQVKARTSSCRLYCMVLTGPLSTRLVTKVSMNPRPLLVNRLGSISTMLHLVLLLNGLTTNKPPPIYGSSDARSYVVTGHLGHDWSKVWILNIDPRSSSFTLVPGNFVSEVLLVNQSVWVEVEATAAAGVSLMMACAARIVTRTQEVTFGKGSPGKKEMGDIEVDENPIDRPQHEAHPSGTQEPPDKTAENIAAN